MDLECEFCSRLSDSWNIFFVGIEAPALGIFKAIYFGEGPRSQISKISCSVHSEGAHFKLNGFEWCRVERRGPLFDLFISWMSRFGRRGPPQAVYPPGWAVVYNRYPRAASPLPSSAVVLPWWTMPCAEGATAMNPNLHRIEKRNRQALAQSVSNHQRFSFRTLYKKPSR